MKETLLNLKAIIPLIRIDLNPLEDTTATAEAMELNDRAIDELLKMSHYLPFHVSEDQTESPTIEIKELKPSDITDDPNFPFEQEQEGRILQFSVKTQYDPSAIEAEFDSENIPIVGRSDLIGLTNEILANELRKKLMNLFLTVNIAKPGSIGFETGRIYVNGHFNTQLDYFNCDYLDQKDFTLESVVRMRELPIMRVWEWFDSIEGTDFDMGVGPIGRAIGALSYTFGPGASYIWPQMIWAHLGLEALYAPKEQLQKYQLTTNIPKLLGKKAVDEDLIERLYALRLQFMHGGADFPFAYSEFNELYGVGDDDEEFFETQHYAILLLMASLQELAERGLTSSLFGENE